MPEYRKEIGLDQHRKFVVTLNGRVLTSTYISDYPAHNVSRYTLYLKVDLDEDTFHDCVFDSALYFTKLKKKGAKKVHPTFIRLLVVSIAKATKTPPYYVVEKVEKETELAYRKPRHVVLNKEDFLRDVYMYKKRVEELEAQS
ncbi:hypothetical protein D878_gp33 [Sulfolobales Mexican rudivirus 1]|uniref:Uncharacterized protein n=1 Tax=Sulfolobales Mexican rod-shaped virus 1 TaxID=2848122 RepID=K4NZH8_9VIRU|nr:hypothetical protein D878_gp33 [Sulfolobales Mexican rudivirus 1]AFV51260.1 hypothetical protein [Sulfolobales Mexican rod-shaped virus 1]